MVEPSSSERFTGAAAYYARFRPDYPSALLERLADRLGLNDDSSGRLLDLGCGPGTIALAVREWFKAVIGLDVNAAMLEQARARATELSATNTRFEMRPAEEIGPDLGTFRLVTVGRALHWMNREMVIERAFDLLEPGGGFATLGNAGEAERTDPWRLAANAVIERYLGPHEPNPWRAPGFEPYEAVLRRSRFATVEIERATSSRTFGLDDLVGRVFSMSSSAPERFGSRLIKFERDLRIALLEVEPSGVFTLPEVFEYTLGLKT